MNVYILPLPESKFLYFLIIKQSVQQLLDFYRFIKTNLKKVFILDHAVKGLKGTVVNRADPSLNRRSVEILRTVPLMHVLHMLKIIGEYAGVLEIIRPRVCQ